MNKFYFPCFCFFMAIPFLSLDVDAQNNQTNDSLKIIKAAKEIMISAKTCALISLDSNGAARVRTMDPFDPQNDFTIWFGTNPKSRKVNQIKNDSRVTLYYLDKDETGYVTVYGTAKIVNDPNKKEKWWKEKWKKFYPNKQYDYALIKVTPIWMEVISESRGIVGNPVNWQPLKIEFNRN